jgi:hypothetical protein
MSDERKMLRILQWWQWRIKRTKRKHEYAKKCGVGEWFFV